MFILWRHWILRCGNIASMLLSAWSICLTFLVLESSYTCKSNWTTKDNTQSLKHCYVIPKCCVFLLYTYTHIILCFSTLHKIVLCWYLRNFVLYIYIYIVTPLLQHLFTYIVYVLNLNLLTPILQQFLLYLWPTFKLFS